MGLRGLGSLSFQDNLTMAGVVQFHAKLFVSEEKFNLSANYCSHIEEHTNDPVYAEIEKEVAFLEINRYLTQYFRLSL